MTAAVVAGAGYVGKRVLSLLEPDCDITAIGRSSLATDEASSELTQQIVDLDSSAEQRIAMPSAATVLYTVPPAPNTREQEVEPRLEKFLALLSSAPIRIVYLSTSGVYGDCDGKLVKEDNPLQPASERAKRRVVAENMLADYCSRHGIGLAVLRVPGIYGPGRLGMENVRAGRPVIVAAEAGPGNRIHVDDLARCCVATMASDAATGVFNVGDGDYRSSSWFAQTVARLANLPPLPEVSRRDAQQQFSARRLSFLNESRRLDTTRMKTVLGFEPSYTNAEDGIRASLAMTADI